MQKYLKTFKKLIEPLGTSNVVIGGALSLKAHGLNMNREAEDMDLIIFDPTPQQINYIKSFEFFSMPRDLPFNVNSYNQRSFKFQKDGLIIDILISKIPVPENLLYYNFDGTFYKVQSVSGTIDAKRSYYYERNENDKTSKYVRNKDVEDFIDLKNSNFNL